MMYAIRKFFRSLTLMHVIGAVVTLVIGFVFYAVWAEATFDYTVCHGTTTYREQHRSSYTSYMTVNNVMIPTHHPARDWTERLYSCPEDDGQRFDKWRRENKQ